MYRASGNVATLACTTRPRRAALRQCHFPFEDDVRRLGCVRMIGIVRVWPVLPDIRVEESFAMKLAFQRFQIFAHFSLGRNIPPAMRATIRRGTKRMVSAPSQFVNPEITELFPAANARSPTRATFWAVS
jgi:hypothetical protein